MYVMEADATTVVARGSIERQWHIGKDTINLFKMSLGCRRGLELKIVVDL